MGCLAAIGRVILGAVIGAVVSMISAGFIGALLHLSNEGMWVVWAILFGIGMIATFGVAFRGYAEAEARKAWEKAEIEQWRRERHRR